ncbi:hypothetical protein HK104_010582 [Borealophlyctis nickersoniae]|nr:hypothetical protein HK104_010582 [Borealophlyctis nickersoniae]
MTQRRQNNPFGAEVSVSAAASSAAVDDDLAALIQETLSVQKQDAEALDRAAAVARQAEQLGQENLVKVHMQGEQLERVAGKMDGVSEKVDSAGAKTDYLTKLTRSIFVPVFGKEKDTSQNRTDTLGAAHAAASKDGLAAPAKLGPDGRPLWGRRTSSLPEGGFGGVDGGGGSAVNGGEAGSSGQQRAGMVGDFASQEDQQMSAMYEQRIDDNLHNINGAVTNMKHMALAMNASLDQQTHVISAIDSSVEVNQEKLVNVDKKLNKILQK